MVSETFIRLIQVARDDESIRQTLLYILKLSPIKRASALEGLIAKIQADGAPSDFVDAIATLRERDIAEKALAILEHV